MPAKNQELQVKETQYLRELRALISAETMVALSIMCSYLFILWFVVLDILLLIRCK